MEETLEARLHVDDLTVTVDDVELLRRVDEHGSVNAAADALDRSFSRALKRIERLEETLGPLLERQRGGPDGGGSTMTEGARRLVDRFVRLQATLSGTADREEVVLRGPTVERDGELVTVDTRVGRIRALLFEPATRVQVIVPAEAVTLQTLESAPPTSATSARNRFPATVSTIDAFDAVARVEVVVSGASIPALITVDSVDLLALEPGDEVLASFKATSARAIPDD